MPPYKIDKYKCIELKITIEKSPPWSVSLQIGGRQQSQDRDDNKFHHRFVCA